MIYTVLACFAGFAARECSFLFLVASYLYFFLNRLQYLFFTWSDQMMCVHVCLLFVYQISVRVCVCATYMCVCAWRGVTVFTLPLSHSPTLPTPYSLTLPLFHSHSLLSHSPTLPLPLSLLSHSPHSHSPTLPLPLPTLSLSYSSTPTVFTLPLSPLSPLSDSPGLKGYRAKGLRSYSDEGLQ